MDPYVFHTLPPPFVLRPSSLVLIYLVVFMLDYILLRQQRKSWLSWLVVIYHLVLPVMFVSPSQPLNIFFTAGPIYVASFTGHLSPTQLEHPSRWIKALATDLVESEQGGYVRLHGVAKMCRGLFKLSLLYSVLDPCWAWLGVSTSSQVTPLSKPWVIETLAYPWYHPMTLLYNLMLGVTAYCLLGIVDIFLGIEQVVSGIRFMDLFDSPILASSPRDFWSRRWNRVVRRQFHGHYFVQSPVAGDKVETRNKSKGFWTSRHARGLNIFMLSGVLHELILWSNCREITLENFCFFFLHGLAVMVETSMTRNQRRLQQKELWLCRGAFLVFMTFTARLFVAPFVRHDFWVPLDVSF
ncbi:hypothetical protein BC941DRAFT_442039 [Chlamydoabsidia padenii]|nr:hypothetical protein BC941DRAFT_442039 [Chlamydoabsidia padenii]